MADQAPPENVNTETGASTDPHAIEFPNRLRVHALAKLIGVTSKQVLAELAALGEQVRTAQSSIDRTVAERVHAALTGGGSEAAPAEAAPVEPAQAATEPAQSEPTPAAPVTAEPESAGPAAAEPATVEAQAVSPLFVAPAPAAELPLFLPPEPVEARPRTAPSAPAEPEAAAETQPQESAAAETESETEAESESDESGATRRRRRGRRGRGRGRGEQGGGEPEKEGAPESASSAETEHGDVEQPSEGKQAEAEQPDEVEAGKSGEENEAENAADGESGEGSRRRRRRRRRKSGSGESAEEGGSHDDPPNTVVHEREPRNKGRGRDEVQGISGSTRLEAKRQRRRDGRDAGRRRPPILSESEFLARREAVDRVMVVREKKLTGEHAGGNGLMTQVGVLEDGVLVEHFVTSAASASMVGNIYLGRVQNVLPSMEAAFVDIGRGRNGVLYAGEVDWDAAGLGGNSRRIEQALKPGDQVLVQVSKDPVGHKGARLTTQVSLAGRFLVYVPGGGSTGISRKLPDTERKRLKEILREIVPSDAGVIIRTASEGVSEEELSRDVTRLQKQWASIQESAEQAKAGKSGSPKALYEEPDLLVKVVRDLFNEDFSKLVVEGERAWDTVETYVKTVAPDLLPRVERHDSNPDVFTVYRIDEQLAKALERKVWLPSGGTLVIDRTEAMTVVDVNTGKFTGSGGNLEETVTRNNLEAAEEIVRQMRLRDIGGMIVVDFIDMVLESNRDLVLRRLTEALGRDRTRHQVSEVTSLGLVQMTRKKLGTGLVEAFSTNCEHCHGRGIVVHADPVVAEGTDNAKPGKSEGSRKSKRSKSGRSEAQREAGHDNADNNTGKADVEKAKADAEAHAHHASEHPMFRAMAAAQTDDQLSESAAEGVKADTTVTGTAPAEAVQIETVEVETPAEPAAAEAVPASDTQALEPPKRRRSRRASRPASTPVHHEAPVAEVIASTVPTPSEPPAEAVGGAEPAVDAAGRPGDEPDTTPRRRPRRRAAARRAGPPVSAEA
ncbi:translation initiation factor IF-2 N-terminal domain-containing protein [Speluncibacter jeojiensis]|uniref:translation initiation factor IF-2 N-terminal domain-containing protein n=1 Tax=Speluncibacter jeojiensis TaxID=2710754 RepID=UPI0038CD174A